MSDNKLIAEFMGYDISISLAGTLLFGMKDKYGYNTCIKIDDLKYHSSWDWLIPVIRKCFGISIELTLKNQLYSINESLLLADIKKAYVAVVEFIKWLNKQ